MAISIPTIRITTPTTNTASNVTAQVSQAAAVEQRPIPVIMTQTAPTINIVATPEPIRQAEVANLQPSPAPLRIPESRPESKLDLLIATNLETLTAKLEAQLPDVRQEMMIIHKALSKDPAQVAILSQEECAILFQGYSKLSGIELVAKDAAKKGKGKDNISVDMFE